VLPTPKNVLFVINRHSGIGFNFDLESRIKETCDKNAVSSSIEFTQYRAHATKLAAEASSHGFDSVVAVGGDGTINEVAQGLLNSNTVMGILPRGSGNGLARHLRIQARLSDAINKLFDNVPIRMDTLMINDRLSLNVSGIGFDGHIANLFANRKIRGLPGYLRLAANELLKFKEFDIEITIGENVRADKAFILAFANSSQYGNNIKIAPSASVRDGSFDLTLMRKVSLLNLRFIYSFLRGNLRNSSLCDLLLAQQALVKTQQPVPYHIDGEPCGMADNFNIKLMPASLSVLVPKAFEASRF
jgi:YegS/Rv2252/BmrU family lipid kinase